MGEGSRFLSIALHGEITVVISYAYVILDLRLQCKVWQQFIRVAFSHGWKYHLVRDISFHSENNVEFFRQFVQQKWLH